MMVGGVWGGLYGATMCQIHKVDYINTCHHHHLREAGRAERASVPGAQDVQEPVFRAHEELAEKDPRHAMSPRESGWAEWNQNQC